MTNLDDQPTSHNPNGNGNLGESHPNCEPEESYNPLKNVEDLVKSLDDFHRSFHLKLQEKDDEIQKLKDKVSTYRSALGAATNLQLSDNDENNSIKLKEDIKSLQDSLDDYVTKCKGDNIQVNFSEVQTLLEKYGSKSNIKDQKPLIKLVLQRHVIETIYNYSKIYFNNPERHYLKLRGIETNVYKQANDLIELTKFFAAGRDGVDETTKLLPNKLRQLIYAALGTRGFNDTIDSKNNKIPHEFISHYQGLLNAEISKYRKHKDPKKNQEIERMAGNIIKEVVTLIWFRLKVQEPVADIIWIKNNVKIDPSCMEGKWDENEIDNIIVDICYFPLIAQEFDNKSKCYIYTPARIFHKTKQTDVDSATTKESEKSEKSEKTEKPEKPEKPEKTEKPEKPEKTEKPEKPEKTEKPEKPEKTEKPEKPEKTEKPEKPKKTE